MSALQNRLSKADRLLFIAQLVKREGLSLAPRREDVEEEVSLALNPHENEQSITSDEGTDANVLPSVVLLSRLADGGDVADAREQSRHTDGDLLTSGERKQAASELWRYRHPVALWLAPISLFRETEARLTA